MGHEFSQLTVHKYMKELGLKSITFKRKPAYIKGKAHKVFENLLKQDFTAQKINTKWCTDFTYIHLFNGSLRYNCSILDLYDRSIVATKTTNYITADLAIETLNEALANNKPEENLILHSDQGVQYTSKAFTEYCKNKKIRQSMSTAGCPYDNSPMESFFGKLRNEHIKHFDIKNDNHLNFLINDYIYGYYHHIRPHSALGGKTPFEMRFT
ncbi:Transposase InsO and inactivated derivatives [Desulfonispora thiosulfatigenes DSM 11270]|uniref:Transposase InsO and inactivated derivatives n=1 Tax=Desulfonispora thiosulfatigenes DSM 11270 TaxID=656914 RepID=A0A1W1UGB2_DESTI|nr:Transposase InsO and inactivated derivatives [Desulfonispora thiosulfatigenes DSM 11270]